MSLYTRILSKFPRNIDYSFAYGSAVKQQVGYNDRPAKMIDFMFCVSDPLQWHAENLRLNEHHYSGIKLLGSKFIANFQECIGARVYCNTLVPMKEEGLIMKYGVISTTELIDDLLKWNHLYVSGRLHKPVDVIINSDCSNLKNAIEKNHESAVRTALLLLPEKFNKIDLFIAISSLSYSGDFRMIFGENKNKVKNIVTPQLREFYNLYLPVLKNLTQYVAAGKENFEFCQEKCYLANEKHLRKLPRNLQDRIIVNSKIKPVKPNIFASISERRDLKDIVMKSVKQIVWKSSILQSLKNIPTAGITKAFSYSWKKALKTFNM